MTWTAEQEAKYRAIEDATVAMPPARREALYDIGLSVIPVRCFTDIATVGKYLRTHGAELIALIEPFLERPE